MKIGERGQVTIPKNIREQFGLGPETEVEFRVVGGAIDTNILLDILLPTRSPQAGPLTIGR